MTRRSVTWQGKRPDKKLKGSPLAYNAGVAERYYRQLRQLITMMTSLTQREVVQLFQRPEAKEYFAMDASFSTQAKMLMDALALRFDDMFGFKARHIAEEVNTQNAKSSESALKMSLKELSQGLTLKTDIFTGELQEILSALVTENVGLITSIPEQYLGAVQGAVMRSITTGQGLADLVPFLDKYKEITLKRARLIAHDQTRKAFSNINRVRLEKLGVKQFEWLHSAGGQTPRPLHVEMNGNVYNFDDPPIIDEKTGERGFPGQLINCRCRMVPVINFNED